MRGGVAFSREGKLLGGGGAGVGLEEVLGTLGGERVTDTYSYEL